MKTRKQIKSMILRTSKYGYNDKRGWCNIHGTYYCLSRVGSKFKLQKLEISTDEETKYRETPYSDILNVLEGIDRKVRNVLVVVAYPKPSQLDDPNWKSVGFLDINEILDFLEAESL